MHELQRLLRMVRPLPRLQWWLDWRVTAATEPPDRSTQVRRYSLTLLALCGVTAGSGRERARGLLNIGLVLPDRRGRGDHIGRAGAGAGGRRARLRAVRFLPGAPLPDVRIGDLHNILALFVFLGLSVLISTLIGAGARGGAQASGGPSDLQRLYDTGPGGPARPGARGDAAGAGGAGGRDGGGRGRLDCAARRRRARLALAAQAPAGRAPPAARVGPGAAGAYRRRARAWARGGPARSPARRAPCVAPLRGKTGSGCWG